MHKQRTTTRKEKIRVRSPPPPIMEGALLCSIPQAAGLVCRGERWVYEAVADGRIEAVKSDGRTLIVIASLHEYVASLPAAKVQAMAQRHKRTRQ
jgi:hypothetical protein